RKGSASSCPPGSALSIRAVNRRGGVRRCKTVARHHIERTEHREPALAESVVCPPRYQVNFTSETPCRGSGNGTTTRPFTTSTCDGAASIWSWPAFSNSAYCASEGGCGEPIFFQTSYELPCCWSTR